MKIILSYTYNKQKNIAQFDTESITIGRKKPDSHTDLDLAPDTTVSRAHARLYYDMSTWWLEDTGSKSGTYRNGAQITQPEMLNDGDTFRIGNTELTVQFASTMMDTPQPDMVVETQFTVDEVKPDERVSESNRMDILVDIQHMARTHSGQALLDAVVAYLLKTFPQANRATIVFHQDKKLLPVAFSPSDRAHVSFTLARKAIVDRQAIAWEHGTGMSVTPHASSLTGATCGMYAPIIQNRLVRGVFHVDSTKSDADFTASDLAMLSEIATQIGTEIITHSHDVAHKIPGVFISYSHKDMDFVGGLAKDLRRDPIRVWFDERLRGGKNWIQQLQQAVKVFDVFILVLSPESVASPYVRDEIEWAKANNKPILPILYRDCTVPDDLKDIQYIPFQSKYNEALSDLITEIRTIS
ncbi:MAG: TIR domain-containing protein [Anaerolineae bacterium]|nr:TIR domain-containing protein [Anaerolineae bacterium]